GGVPGGARRREARAAFKGLGFVAPWLVGLALFTLYPVAASVIYSFCDYSVLTIPRWVGWDNFADLAADGVFWLSLKNTILYAAFALPLGLLIALAVALLLDTQVKGMGVYRTLFFLPSVTPLVASAIVWLWIFNSQFGVLNYVLGRLSFGLLGSIPWLSDARYAMPALILMSFWGVGHTVVILLAARQDVP
ncbi:MAG: sugar ABC transporter permease, partial [bacterium]